MNLDFLAGIFTSFENRFGKNPVFVSIRRGFTLMTPLILIGSFALIVLSLPIPGYQQFMLEFFGSQWANMLQFVQDGTFHVFSITIVISISYSLCTEYDERYGLKAHPLIMATVSLGSYMALLGISKSGFSLSSFGVIGMFLAIVVSVTSSLLFLKLSSIQALKFRAFTNGANYAFNFAISSIIPATVTIVAFACVNQFLTVYLGVSNLQAYISGFFSGLFLGSPAPLLTALLFVLLIDVFWFFGMHGSNILEPVAQSLFVPALVLNRGLVAAGSAPTEIFTKTFFDSFVFMGGCGSILCLVLAIFIAGKHKNLRRLAKFSLPPVLININELVVFGMPIVLNPVYMIPFLCVPLILTITSFLATLLGLVPYTYNPVEWTTPVFLSGYTATGSISGGILQLFNLALGTLLYIPFVKLAQKVADAQGKNNLEKVYAFFKTNEERGTIPALLTRHDEIGNITRFLASDLDSDLRRGNVSVFYQPLVNFSGRVTGVEALLRWNHESHGYIYPPLAIGIAEEAQIIRKLGRHVLDTALGDLKKIHESGFNDITMSINLSASQLEDDTLLGDLEEAIRKHRVHPGCIHIEITEQLALTGTSQIIGCIQRIKKLGIKLVMDDFGMGHSSLLYLKEYEIDTIKFDGSLVREISSNSNCRNIISSIVYLSRSINCNVLAEYVEREEQRTILHELGCDHYQGFLYSKAIPFCDLIAYIFRQNGG